MKAQNYSSVDDDEIERFSRIADEWWSETGKFAPLHSMNQTRIDYIISKLPPISNLNILDIGCGGGLISEPLAKIGAKVTAIDASAKNIAVAKLHAQKSGLNIDYRCSSVEEMEQTQQFDVILALEILEHVADIDYFLHSSCKLLKPNGIIICSTLNRTAKSYALAILGAEYILRWLPIGTHTWKKFIKPSELCKNLEQNGIMTTEIIGMTMNPINRKWQLNQKDLAVNYIVIGKNL